MWLNNGAIYRIFCLVVIYLVVLSYIHDILRCEMKNQYTALINQEGEW